MDGKFSFITPYMLPNFVENNKEMDEKQKIIDGLRKQVADLEALGYQQAAMAYPTENGGFDTYLAGGGGFGYEDALEKSYQNIAKPSTL